MLSHRELINNPIPWTRAGLAACLYKSRSLSPTHAQSDTVTIETTSSNNWSGVMYALCIRWDKEPSVWGEC